MPNIPRLTPFWFKPDPEEAAEFHLKPLTTPEYMEVEDTFVRDGDLVRPSNRSYIAAARFGVIGVKNLIDPDTGRKALWPSCMNWLPPSIIVTLGLRLILAAQGKDWDRIGEEPAPDHEDLEKN